MEIDMDKLRGHWTAVFFGITFFCSIVVGGEKILTLERKMESVDKIREAQIRVETRQENILSNQNNIQEILEKIRDKL